jgi:hypothetical protein
VHYAGHEVIPAVPGPDRLLAVPTACANLEHHGNSCDEKLYEDCWQGVGRDRGQVCDGHDIGIADYGAGYDLGCTMCFAAWWMREVLVLPGGRLESSLSWMKGRA